MSSVSIDLAPTTKDDEGEKQMKFEIKNRRSGDVQFIAEIDCDETSSFGIKVGLAVRWAYKSNTYLGGSYLGGSYLRGAYLGGADLGGAYLRDAPIVENIDAAILAAINAGGKLKMSDWHTCKTTHCRAGWAVTLAGDAGKELEANSDDATKLLEFMRDEFGWDIRPDSALGIKPISITGSKRLIRAAINYAIANDRKSVTLVHKGNIMKFTEGAFRTWGYELAKEEFPNELVSWEDSGGDAGDKILIQDVIADAMFQQVLTRPANYDVIATMNLNGDFISDALAAQVGGIGIAPGGNINYETGVAVFEATHGTAPKYAGLNKVNPGSVILSGEMMFNYIGWKEAGALMVAAIEKAISEKIVTYDFARLMDNPTEVSTSAFGDAIIERL